LRILHIINGLGRGGTESVLYELATYPSDVHHEVICVERRGSYSEKLEAHGVPVHHLDWTSLGASPRAWFRLLRLIRRADADVVQTWMYRSNIVGGIAAKRADIPVVWNIRCSSLAPLRPASRVLARIGGMLAGSVPSAIVNCSENSVREHEQLGYRGKVVAIPNGYDPDDFRPNENARAATRTKLGVAPNTFLIGSIGRWHPQKGHGVLLRALSILRDRGIPCKLLLVGKDLDASNADLTGLIAEQDCTDLVQLAGERSDVPAIATAIDLHVLASVGGEGFPNVIAETMLAGTPNVATDVGDSAMIVGSGGWIVPPRDPEHLADAIAEAHSKWSASPEQWRTRKQEGRRHIAANFALKRMVEAYEKLWAKVARER
jgi:glycosyltransferase involved in cell wall biosynthesis